MLPQKAKKKEVQPLPWDEFSMFVFNVFQKLVIVRNGVMHTALD